MRDLSPFERSVRAEPVGGQEDLLALLQLIAHAIGTRDSTREVQIDELGVHVHFIKEIFQWLGRMYEGKHKPLATPIFS